MNKNEYNKIFDNAISHINYAKILAKEKLYGFATSHLILGMEELIKYQIIVNSSFDKIKDLISEHSKKHNLIKEFQQAISEDFIKSILQIQKEKPLTQKEICIQKNRFKEIGSFLYHSYKKIILLDEEREIFFKWLKNANYLKNKGFYVDCDDSSYVDITENEFNKALKYVEMILKQTEVFKNLNISEEELITFLNSSI